jgi:hypothetical protein
MPMKILFASHDDGTTSSLALALTVSALALPCVVNAQPAYNSEAFCELRAIVGISADGGWSPAGADPRSQVAFCVESERAAESDIASRWSSIPESIRRSCELVARDYVSLQKCVNGTE